MNPLWPNLTGFKTAAAAQEKLDPSGSASGSKMELAAVSAAMFVIDSMQTNGQLPDATRFPRITVGIFSAGKHE